MQAAATAYRRPILHIAVFAALTGYFGALCVHFSNRRMMWPDEFDGWNLLTDPSWHHMVQSWNRGADGGSLLFYAIGRWLLSITGYHVLTMRLFSAFCLWAAAVLWWRMLRRSFSGFSALIAVLLIWLCDPLFVYQLAEARFYGLLVLSTTLAVNAIVWTEDRQVSPGVAFLICSLANGLLVSSHFLGLIFSAVLIGALVLSKFPVRTRLAAIGGSLSSWLFFLAYIKPIRSGSQNFNWIEMPTIPNLLRYYFHTPTPERFFNGALVVFIVASFVYCIRRTPELLKQRSTAILLLIAVLFLLLPSGCYVLSHLYHPLFAGRYLMPYSLGFGCVLACALWLMTRRDAFQRHRGLRVALQIGSLCIVGVLHFICLRQQEVRPLSDLQPLLALKSPLPIVIPYDTIFYQMRFYGGPAGANTFFPVPSSTSGYLTLLAQQGYAPGVVSDAEFLEQHRQFLYLDFPIHREFYLRSLAGDPKWVSKDIGTVQLRGFTIHILRIERQ